MWNRFPINKSSNNKNQIQFKISPRQKKMRQNPMYSSHPPNLNSSFSSYKIKENLKKNQKFMDDKLVMDNTTRSQVKQQLDLSKEIDKNGIRHGLSNENVINLTESSIYLQFDQDDQYQKSKLNKKQKQKIIGHYPKNYNKNSYGNTRKKIEDYQVEKLKNVNRRIYPQHTYQQQNKQKESYLNKSKSQPKMNFYAPKYEKQISNKNKWKSFDPQQNQKFKYDNLYKTKKRVQFDQNQKVKRKIYDYTYQELFAKIKQYQDIILNVCNAYNEIKIYRNVQDKQILRCKKQIEQLTKDNQTYKWICSQDLKIKSRIGSDILPSDETVRIQRNILSQSPIQNYEKSGKEQQNSSRLIKNISSLRTIKNNIIQGLNSVKESNLKQQRVQYPIMRLNKLRSQQFPKINLNDQIKLSSQKEPAYSQLQPKYNIEHIKTPSFNNGQHRSQIISHQLYEIHNPKSSHAKSININKIQNEEQKDHQIEELRANQAQLLDKMRQKDLMIDQMMQLLVEKSKELW